ncbi:hypothetical protein FNV43_RR21609 [Rhamnella rubrinervis]|uniref:Amino acid transporter transmembrane domain-containing protein n=1 Tax=Rhamnella rubrinervis TaxID=2594499 RepID=A0A8K0DUX5_9ROSA|nr:hypothetical protein FNV43_RR21609 [Rhamnella rubrinervis]
MATEVERKINLDLETVVTEYDDDGRLKRQGNLVTASAHIITAVIGSGVLSLAWAIAQLGLVAGVIVLILFSFITLYTSRLLANSYRSPDPILGARNYTYMQAVRNNLGGTKYKVCGLFQYGSLVGVTIGYTVASSFSASAIKRSNCFHKHGHDADCHASNEVFMIWFGIIQIILSQVPNFHKLSGLSIIAAIMSFNYATIGLGLSIAKVVAGREHENPMTIEVTETNKQKMWNRFEAIGDIAFAYAYATVLIEIQDTLKSSPPENQVMKKASAIGVSITTIFYMSCGILGCLAFGNQAPGNFLTGFGFYEPFWLVDYANACIVVHLIGAYQVFSQPVYRLVEDWSNKQWPECEFIAREYPITIPLFGTWSLNLFRSIWRTMYVIVTTTLGVTFPFFNDVLGLFGAASFWPLTVYFPIEMHISQAKIPTYSFKWLWLRSLSLVCLVLSLIAAAASIQGIVKELKHYRPFNSVY